MRKRFLVLGLLGASASANAAWTGIGNVGNLDVVADGATNSVRITHDHMVNPAGCGNAAALEAPASVPGFQQIYSVLLAARTADRRVDIQVSDSSCTANGFPLVTQVSYRYVAGGGVVDALPLATPSLDGLMSAADKAKLDATSGSSGTELFTHSGSFTVPPGVTRVFVTMCGAGGGGTGGRGGTYDNEGSPKVGRSGVRGGSTYVLLKQSVAVSPGQTVPVTVGVGGGGGLGTKYSNGPAGAGSAGGDSVFGSLTVSGASGAIDDGSYPATVWGEIPAGMYVDATLKVPTAAGVLVQPCAGGLGGEGAVPNKVGSPGSRGADGFVRVEW